jgi:hypothetical protein
MTSVIPGVTVNLAQQQAQASRRKLGVARARLAELEGELRSAERTLAQRAAQLFRDGGACDVDELLPLQAHVTACRARVEIVVAAVGVLDRRF